jgi:hypothetical protein
VWEAKREGEPNGHINDLFSHPNRTRAAIGWQCSCVSSESSRALDAGERNLWRYWPGAAWKSLTPAGQLTELIHAALVEQADHFEQSPLLRRVMEPIPGNGLVTSENAFHKRQRKLIAPAFPHRQLTSLVPLMAQATEHLQSQWQDGEVIDLAQQMMHDPGDILRPRAVAIRSQQ